MAEAPYRNMNADMQEGAVDGTVKRIAPDRGGLVEPQPEREMLDEKYDHRDTPSMYKDDLNDGLVRGV